MRYSRTGITLVDAVVFFVCAGIALALVIPSVSTSREVSRVSECGVKVKNLALAAIQYQQTNGHLPGWVDKFGFFTGGMDSTDPSNNGELPVEAHVKVGGYGVALLPWLEAQPTYEHWTDDRYPVIHHGNPAATFRPTKAVGLSQSGAGYHPLATPNLPHFICPSNPVVDAESGRNTYITNNGMCYLRSSAAASAGGGVTSGLVQSQIDAQRTPMRPLW